MFPTHQHVIPVSKCPCCLDLLADDTVIAGTYELDSAAGDDHRTGSLCIMRDKQLLLEKECPDGGVFDLQIIPNQDDSDDVSRTASPHALVAHANGCIALYKLSADRSELSAVARCETGSCLLTSLNAIPAEASSSYWVGVGTSDGQLHMLKLHDMSRFEPWISVSENRDGQPVWCVRLIRWKEKLLIFTGSDDCSWKIFVLREDSLDLEPIYRNKDAHAGVTAIQLQLQFEAESERMNGSAMIASYDENLRSYSITIDCDNGVKVVKQSTQHVPGSGIWRIRSAPRFGKSILLIAGMYSGIHAFDPEHKELESKDWPAASGETAESRQLIYDVIQTGNGDLIVASFYEKCLYLLCDK